MDPTNKYLGYPVRAYNDSNELVYPSRAAASKAIAKIRGSKQTTTDKEIRLAIRYGNTIYGYKWEYITE